MPQSTRNLLTVMRCFTAILHLAAIATVCVARETKDKRDAAEGSLLGGDDSHVSETGFSGAATAGSKYFQYAHVPAKDHYEHGHKRGNEHHFIERHEKAHPHAGEFKTKVRWGDKHGGYGEHYWDYNHAGHDHDGEGGETVQQEQYVAAPQQEEQAPFAYNRKKRAPGALSGDVEFISSNAKLQAITGSIAKHGGNYRRLPGADRAKRGNQQRAVYTAHPNHREVDDRVHAPFGWQPVQFKF